MEKITALPALEFSFKNSVRYGVGAASGLPDYLERSGFRRPGIIVDANLRKGSPQVAALIGRLAENPDAIVHEYDLAFEPTYRYLDRIVKEFKRDGKARIDALVGIGGGSAMDTAKALAVMCANEGRALDFRGFPTGLNAPLPMIAIPSTTGTGSELVYNASIIDDESRVKMGINDVNNAPRLAFLDPEIVASAPMSVLASSGCDALVHALESFVSVKSNPITRLFSTEALKYILNCMPRLLAGEKELSLWGGMQWGAYLAMAALSNTSSGPTGALSYYLGVNFNVPHGIAGGVFIGRITRLNHERGCRDYAQLYDALFTPSTTEGDATEKSLAVVEKIERLIEQAGMTDALRDFHLRVEDIDGFKKFADKARAAFDFNPIKIGADDVGDLLHRALV